MNMKENIEDLKMDKKTFKKLSKGSAFDDIYEPMVNVALGLASDLDKADRLLDEAEEDVRISKNKARESKKLADEANVRADEANVRADEATVRADEANVRADEANVRADEANVRADEANERAESAENKVNEARELQNECKSALKLLDDEIKFKIVQTETARKSVSVADEEFNRSMAENLHLSAQNKAIKKATVDTADEEFARAFEGFKKSRIDENNRQMRLNKETANKMRDVSVDRRVEAEGYERRINFLKEQRNKALIAYAEACLNMELGE